MQRFVQYLASRNTLFNLSNFLDKSGLQGNSLIVDSSVSRSEFVGHLKKVLQLVEMKVNFLFSPRLRHVYIYQEV